MLIKTKDHGQIEIDEQSIIIFSKGVYAFEGVKEFVLLDRDADNGIVELQAVKEENPRFFMFDPFLYIEGYNPILSKDDLKALNAASLNDLNIFVIAVIPDDIKKITVNLKSPVLINFNLKIGMQCILENNYLTRYFLFEEERTEK